MQINRTLWIDYAKAIGIILVVYGHVTRGIYNAHIAMDEKIFRLFDSIIYSFHMPLFFFLSGKFFYNSLRKRGWKGLVANKIDSIFYLYIIWSIMQSCIELLFSKWTNKGINITEIFSLLWEPRVQFWFLYALFFITLIATLVYTYVDKKYSLAVFILTALLVILGVQTYSNILLIYILPNICFFMFGIYFNQIEDSIMAHKYKLLLPFAILFVTANWYLQTILNLEKTALTPSIKLSVTLVSILFTVILSMCAADKPNKIFALIGSSSMVIYLVHVITGSGARIILNHFLGVSNFYVHLVIGMTAGIFGSIILEKILSRINGKFLFEIPEKFSVEKTMRN